MHVNMIFFSKIIIVCKRFYLQQLKIDECFILLQRKINFIYTAKCSIHVFKYSKCIVIYLMTYTYTSTPPPPIYQILSLTNK